MYTILMGLFTGNINIPNKPPSDFPLRRYYTQELDKLTKRLEDLLNDEEKELLTELLEMNLAEGGYSDMDSFINGFRLGSQLMVEVLHDKENFLVNKEQYLRHFIHCPYKGTSSAIDNFKENEKKA